MNGLIQSQMDEELPGDPAAPDETPPHEQAEPAAMEQQEEAGEGLEAPEDLTPEQEEAYERFMLAASRVLYEKGYAEDVVQALKAAESLDKGMADLTYELVAELDTKSKGILPDELIAPAALDILGEIAEVAKAAGATIAGREIASAAVAMIERYLTENGASPEDLQALLGSIDIDAMGAEIDKGESPDDVMGGLVEGAQAAPAPAAPEEVPQ